jgi:hypothetical protein
MRENTLGDGLNFAAKNFVTVNSEPEKKILLFSGSFLTKRENPAFTASSFPG